jgi:hypothetical protein
MVTRAEVCQSFEVRWVSPHGGPPDAWRRTVLLAAATRAGTGARQTGKTTLARSVWPDLVYHSLDDLEIRQQLRDVSPRGWARAVGPAILDEAQKEPSVFEKVKLAYDAGGYRVACKRSLT